MSKKIATGGLILWLLSLGNFVLAETITLSDYFPLVDGDSWNYIMTEPFGTYLDTETVQPGTTIINSVATKAKQSSDMSVSYWTSDTNGIRLHRVYDPEWPATTLTMNPPIIFARGIMNIPETVQSEGWVFVDIMGFGTGTLNYTATTTLEEKEMVTVPAGTFEAIRVRSREHYEGTVLEEVFDYTETGYTWLAKCIGTVKSITTDDEGTEVWQLTSTNIPSRWDSADPCPGYIAGFLDVPESHWAASFIEILALSGITSGCNDVNYCPNDPVTRAQMAVFLERGMRGSGYDPGPGVGNIFLDVPLGYWAGGWIELLFMDGITRGCDATHYCPGNSTTRAEMAVFLLRAKYGMDYAPPTPVGVFNDVAVTYWAAGWIEQLAAEGITSGCGDGNYCPNASVNRAQMAVFLVRTFELE